MEIKMFRQFVDKFFIVPNHLVNLHHISLYYEMITESRKKEKKMQVIAALRHFVFYFKNSFRNIKSGFSYMEVSYG